MKDRNGFVSNSSSSSFIILGESLGQGCPGIDTRFEDKQIFALGSQPGRSGDCAADIFEVSAALYETMESNGILDKFEFYAGLSICDGSAVESKNLPDKFKVYTFDKDYSCVESSDDIEEYYADEIRAVKKKRK